MSGVDGMVVSDPCPFGGKLRERRHQLRIELIRSQPVGSNDENPSVRCSAHLSPAFRCLTETPHFQHTEWNQYPEVTSRNTCAPTSQYRYWIPIYRSVQSRSQQNVGELLNFR